MALLKNEQRMHWYVMRDLKRPNAMAVKVEKWQTNP